MKRIIILCTLLVMALLMQSAFRTTETPLQEVRSLYLDDLSNFKLKGEAFDETLRSESSSQARIKAFQELRHSFKRIEFMLDYLQPQDVRDHINGAPLPKTERNAPRLVVLEPKGLQRMEELVYAEHLDLGELKKLSREFVYQVQQVERFAQRIPFDDRQVFEAMRMGLLRIMSLGITGFDTPMSNQAIAESKTAWQAIAAYLEFYLAYSEDSKLKESISYHFREGEQMLGQSDFDSFDRGAFIRLHLQPLYALLLDLHHDLKYETALDLVGGVMAYDYSSRDIFSADFFRLEYYTGLDPEASEFLAQKKLGRLLFFDPALSANLERNCASCHHPDKAFSDGIAKSHATGGGFVSRNAPGLFNALYSEKFFHDLRADRMETQMEHVIFSPKEFASSYKAIFNKLRSSEEYQRLFKEAFPKTKGQINRYQLSVAIMAFMSDLKSFDSKVDRYLRGEDIELSGSEQRGLNLFMGEAACGTCHFAPSFSGLVPPLYQENESEVLGVLKTPGLNELDPDEGRYASGTVQDEAEFFRFSFKTPTVRNIEYTAPYFHNGAYEDLKSVLDFYNHGGALGLGMELPNQTLPGDSLKLSSRDLADLEAFMMALSDTAGLIRAPKRLPKIEGLSRPIVNNE